jgi:hypothetical protein
MVGHPKFIDQREVNSQEACCTGREFYRASVGKPTAQAEPSDSYLAGRISLGFRRCTMCNCAGSGVDIVHPGKNFLKLYQHLTRTYERETITPVVSQV